MTQSDLEALRAGIALLPELRKRLKIDEDDPMGKFQDNYIEDQKTVIAALEAAKQMMDAPDPLGEALNSGAGVYRP